MNDFRPLAKFIAKVNVPAAYFELHAPKNYKFIKRTIGNYQAQIEVFKQGQMYIDIFHRCLSGDFAYIDKFTFVDNKIYCGYHTGEYLLQTLTEEFIKANKVLTK